MKVGLFVPCYIDQFYPQVAQATLELLEKQGVAVEVPLEQTCCGQPMANSGCEIDSIPASQHFVKLFADYDYVVGPSGSCVLHVRDHYHLLEQTPAVKKVRQRTYELCEFLTDILKLPVKGQHFSTPFPHRVGLHLSCHGQRGMRMAQSSELVGGDFSKMRDLLQLVDDIDLVDLERKDECCGFGGTFAVSEEAVSVKMGIDRIRDHEKQAVEVITGGDVSCLMHMEGIIRRQKKPIRVMHIAEILNGNQP